MSRNCNIDIELTNLDPKWNRGTHMFIIESMMVELVELKGNNYESFDY
jgi:hypothetical protein